MGNFLEELQSLDERTKSRVLIVTTIVIMAIIIYFWLGYFNSIVSSGVQPAVADANQPADTADSGQTAQPAGSANSQPGFFTSMGNGMATMVHAFENIFQAPSKYIIKPQ